MALRAKACMGKLNLQEVYKEQKNDSLRQSGTYMYNFCGNLQQNTFSAATKQL